jgi:hypothetical protein
LVEFILAGNDDGKKLVVASFSGGGHVRREGLDNSELAKKLGSRFRWEGIAALEMTRVSLGLADDLANGIIAKPIIELAKAGERHPELLCEGALKTLRAHLFGD